MARWPARCARSSLRGRRRVGSDDDRKERLTP